MRQVGQLPELYEDARSEKKYIYVYIYIYMSYIFNFDIVAMVHECAEKGGIFPRTLLFTPFNCEV